MDRIKDIDEHLRCARICYEKASKNLKPVWARKLQRLYFERILYRHFGEFPFRLAFVLKKSNEGKMSIAVKEYKNKTIDINNITFSDLKNLTLGEGTSTPLGVWCIKSTDDYFDIVNSLGKSWLD